ncbi:protein of unknown function [Acidithiobacillus ferrivorans]|uniref:Transposase n=1 Tax=Acidithiobacillus ferrivorans TaxID=160808 RepID=A0ABY1MQX1_9PROT|nr:protein of unknown function [Acidithiobacillus ferrivorans]
MISIKSPRCNDCKNRTMTLFANKVFRNLLYPRACHGAIKQLSRLNVKLSIGLAASCGNSRFL